MNTFFDFYRYTNPSNVAFNLMDMRHLSMLLILSLGIAIICLLYRRSKKRDFFMKAFAIFIFILEGVRQVSFFLVQGWFLPQYLPFHLCNIMIFLIVYYSFTENEKVGEVLYGLGLPGYFAALLFPDWTMFPFFNFYGLHSWIIHALLVSFTLMLLLTGEIRPHAKNMVYVLAFAIIIAIPIYVINVILGTNFLFINAGSPGSPLEVLVNFFGTPWFILPYFLLVILIIGLLYVPWYVRDRKIERRCYGEN